MTGRAWVLFALAILVAGISVLAVFRCEGAPPSIAGPSELVVGRGGAAVAFEVADEGSGLRAFEAKLVHAEGEVALLTRRWAGSALPFGAARTQREQEIVIPLEPETHQVPQGSAFLELRVHDRSWRHGFRGNETSLRVPVTVDLSPPRVTLESGLTYVRHGGAGVLVYSASEPTQRDGIQVGEHFFPGFALAEGEGAGGRRAALFAIPVESSAEVSIQVVAVDRAGNHGVARPAVRVQEQSFPAKAVQLSSHFLEGKVVELAAAEGIDAADPVAAFRIINSQVRARDEARIRELVRNSEPRPLFQGAFEQLRNSKVTSRFAERRSYSLDDQPVSEAIHYGFDLASTAGAAVTAANAGRVIHAGQLGIYGGCVLLDHGLGLASLYGHLSQIDVSPGDRVRKGQTLGRSGQTGLAGGDHLHFAMLVAGIYVDPLEWWDAKWLNEHVQVRLSTAGP